MNDIIFRTGFYSDTDFLNYLTCGVILWNRMVILKTYIFFESYISFCPSLLFTKE